MSLDSNLGETKRDEEETHQSKSEKLLEMQQKIIDKNTLDLQKLVLSSTSDDDDYNDDDEDELLWIHDELDKLFDAEKVGKLCDLCCADLAADPERPRALLRSLQEVCVLACGHVYHYKCLKGTTLDLENKSTDPFCIFCVSSSNCN